MGKKSSKNKKCQTVDAGVKDLKQKSNKDAHSQTQMEKGIDAAKTMSNKMVQTQNQNVKSQMGTADKASLRARLSLKIPFAQIEKLQMISATLKRINRHQKNKLDVSMTDKFINIVKSNKFIVYQA